MQFESAESHRRFGVPERSIGRRGEIRPTEGQDRRGHEDRPAPSFLADEALQRPQDLPHDRTLRLTPRRRKLPRLLDTGRFLPHRS